MTTVRNVFLLPLLLLSFGFAGCSSDPETTEPAVTDEIQEPEQVSFADWERPENCELGTMPVIGEAECQRVGSVCPASDWPAAIPEADQVIYVQPGAEGDGTSKTSAIGKISDAVELAEDGAVIVLSKGLHKDNVLNLLDCTHFIKNGRIKRNNQKEAKIRYWYKLEKIFPELSIPIKLYRRTIINNFYLNK